MQHIFALPLPGKLPRQHQILKMATCGASVEASRGLGLSVQAQAEALTDTANELDAHDTRTHCGHRGSCEQLPPYFVAVAEPNGSGMDLKSDANETSRSFFLLQEMGVE